LIKNKQLLMNKIIEARKLSTSEMIIEMKKIKDAVKSRGIGRLDDSRISTAKTYVNRKPQRKKYLDAKAKDFKPQMLKGNYSSVPLLHKNTGKF
jgi:ketol-acid reductoisomerase